jgi:hypothetical protein
LLSEILSVKNDISSSEALEDRMDAFDIIDKNFKKFEELCEEQQIKFQNLKD